MLIWCGICKYVLDLSGWGITWFPSFHPPFLTLIIQERSQTLYLWELIMPMRPLDEWCHWLTETWNNWILTPKKYTAFKGRKKSNNWQSSCLKFSLLCFSFLKIYLSISLVFPCSQTHFSQVIKPVKPSWRGSSRFYPFSLETWNIIFLGNPWGWVELHKLQLVETETQNVGEDNYAPPSGLPRHQGTWWGNIMLSGGGWSYFFQETLFLHFLFWSKFRLTEKLQKLYREFTYTLHPAFPHVSIFWYNHQNQKINISTGPLTKWQTLFWFHQYSH